MSSPEPPRERTPEATLPATLADWCGAMLGRYAVQTRQQRPWTGARLWRLSTADHGSVYLKVPARSERWANEVHAYEHWAPSLGDEAPRLIAVHEAPPHAMLLTELSGLAMNRAVLSKTQQLAAWQAAGAALARLHALPVGRWFGVAWRDGKPQAMPPASDPVRLIGSTLESWLVRAVEQDLLDNREIATARRALHQVEIFAGEHPVPCHGDYRPRNWFVTPAGEWSGVLDFEHARWDIRLHDIGLWWDYHGWEQPDLAQAFFAGYGRALGELDRAQLKVIRLIAALSRVVSGNARQAYATERLGRRVLACLADRELTFL